MAICGGLWYLDGNGDEYDGLECIRDNSQDGFELITTYFHIYMRSPTIYVDNRP